MYVYSEYGSFYRATKQASEGIIETYHNEYGIEYLFLRYGSLYGPRSQEWNGMRDYATQVINNGVVNYSGDGNEMREYIHVKDAARLSVEVLINDFKNAALMITGQQQLTINDVLKLIFEISGKKLSINFKNEGYDGSHYKNTPYKYTPKGATKIVPTEFIDLGQGILELIEDITKSQ